MNADDTQGKVERTDIATHCNRITFPHRYETQGDADRVQWAARRAVAALERLSLECEIATARNTSADAGRTAKRQRELAQHLAKLRAKK